MSERGSISIASVQAVPWGGGSIWKSMLILPVFIAVILPSGLSLQAVCPAFFYTLQAVYACLCIAYARQVHCLVEPPVKS